ncbi:hypothetical protein DEV91_116124 [Phyllobacterium brassicacearum]|nr:hypothetical protein DEV91_116124 [Phyllobacterium brassicacearum]
MAVHQDDARRLRLGGLGAPKTVIFEKRNAVNVRDHEHRIAEKRRLQAVMV